MPEFCMPSLGADMVAGTIIEWLVKPGDHVKRGDIIAVVDTEKATIEVEVFLTGIVESILVAAGDKVPVGTALALIRDGAASATRAESLKQTVTSPPRAEAALPPMPSPVLRPAAAVTPVTSPPEASAYLRTAPAAGKRLRISPVAMRMALEMQVDLAKVQGTGPGVKERVRAAP
jgi:pyruvate dehydrogenase E2 component (dihydrolipoamide acetyltransferase)